MREPPVEDAPRQGCLLHDTLIAGLVQSARAVWQGELFVKIGRQQVVLRLGDQTVTWPLAKAN
jgi:hypothetical protein